jgi:hypothetical protein
MKEQNTSKHDPKFEELVDYEMMHKKQMKWKTIVIVGIISVVLLFMAIFEFFFPWLRVFFAISGGILAFYFLFHISTTKYGKGGWSGPWFGDGPL